MILPILYLTRNSDDGRETMGEFLLKNDDGSVAFTCVTLELPFKGNLPEVSCIPADDYTCVKVPASEHIPYPHISITNVPGRSGVCIHILNYVRELRGCIGVGLKLFDLDGDGEPDLVSSKISFDKLMALLPDTFTLKIAYKNQIT